MSAIAAKSKYDRAMSRINKIETSLQEAMAEMARLKQTQLLSEEGKKRKLTEIRDTTLAAYNDGRKEIEELLQAADSLAHTALAGDPTDAALESRKARAATRVGRLIDGGVAAAKAAEVFAEAGDLDALRALRDEIPSVVAAVDAGDRLGTRVRTQEVRALTLAVDRMMAPLLPQDEAQAARLRDNIEMAQGWVKALGEDTIKGLNGTGVGLNLSVFYRDQLAAV